MYVKIFICILRALPQGYNIVQLLLYTKFIVSQHALQHIKVYFKRLSLEIRLLVQYRENFKSWIIIKAY